MCNYYMNYFRYLAYLTYSLILREFHFRLSKIFLIALSACFHITRKYNSLKYTGVGIKTLSLPKLESVSNSFIYSCDSLEEFTVPKGLKAFGNYFIYNCKSLKRVTFEDGFCGKYSTTCLFSYTVCNCANLEYIYLPASIDMDDNAITTATYHIGSGCPNVTTVELGQGYKQTLYLSNMPNLSHDNLLQNLNALADLTGQTAKKLVLGSVNLAKLTDEEKAIATNKNWTLS